MCISSLLLCHRLLVENCLSSRFLRRVGKPQFMIQLNVLDLVYSQTVSWVGVFYCPLLPAISIFKLLTIFYISKVCLDGVQRSKYTQSLVVENPFLKKKKKNAFLLFSSSIWRNVATQLRKCSGPPALRFCFISCSCWASPCLPWHLASTLNRTAKLLVILTNQK